MLYLKMKRPFQLSRLLVLHPASTFGLAVLALNTVPFQKPGLALKRLTLVTLRLNVVEALGKLNFRLGWGIILLVMISQDTVAQQPRLRKKPIAGPVLELGSATFPKPLVRGGGDAPMGSLLEGEWSPSQPNVAAAPWIEGHPGKFVTQGRTISDTRFYFVLQPPVDKPNENFGIAAMGTRNYDGYLQAFTDNNQQSWLSGEDDKGGGMRVRLKADATPAVDAPRLIEFHPAEEGSAEVRINGIVAGKMSSNLTLNYFGIGYASVRGFNGRLGEIRLYDDKQLTPQQAEDVSHLLLAYWNLNSANLKPGNLIPDAGILFADGYRAEPAILSAETTWARSGELIVQTTPLSDDVTKSDDAAKSNKRTYIGASDRGVLRRQRLPVGGTLALTRSWHVGGASQTANVVFNEASTLGRETLGSNGFYSLLYRTQESDDWQEAAVTSLNAQRLIAFANVSLEPGFYSLGVVQGVPYQDNAAKVLVNGAPLEDSFDLVPGQRLTFTTAGALPQSKVEITGRHYRRDLVRRASGVA